jgi:hypothetical protein
MTWRARHAHDAPLLLTGARERCERARLPLKDVCISSGVQTRCKSLKSVCKVSETPCKEPYMCVQGTVHHTVKTYCNRPCTAFRKPCTQYHPSSTFAHRVLQSSVKPQRPFRSESSRRILLTVKSPVARVFIILEIHFFFAHSKLNKPKQVRQYWL